MKLRIFLLMGILVFILSACSTEELGDLLDRYLISDDEEDKEDKEDKEDNEDKEMNEEMKMCREVFEDALIFHELSVNHSQAAKVMEDGGFPDEISNLYEAVDIRGETIGYVVQITTEDGYYGDIVMLVGITNDGFVNGYSIISHQETQGLGTKAFESAYADQFVGISITDISDIDTISGATLTSKAVINGVNAAIAYLSSIGVFDN